MENFNQNEEKLIQVLEDSPGDLNLLPQIQNGTFLDDNFNYCFQIDSPMHGDDAPSVLPTLTETAEDDCSEFFYILNPINGKLEAAGPSNPNLETEENYIFDDNTEVIPSKKIRRELTIYEETILKEFSKEIDHEQKLLSDEHAMKMKLWELEMQTSQQQHALKMAILKEKLEKVKQERENLRRHRDTKYLNKFSSGPI